MTENNSYDTLKTAEVAAHPHLVALRTIAEYPATDSLMNMDAANMRRIAAQAVAAQTQPADALDAETPYQRGYRHGYNQRDAEVQGALL